MVVADVAQDGMKRICDTFSEKSHRVIIAESHDCAHFENIDQSWVISNGARWFLGKGRRSRGHVVGFDGNHRFGATVLWDELKQRVDQGFAALIGKIAGRV